MSENHERRRTSVEVLLDTNSPILVPSYPATAPMYTITDACTNCGKCVPECPIDAIEVDEPIYVITELCCDFAECVVVCPEDAIVPLEEAVDDG